MISISCVVVRRTCKIENVAHPVIAARVRLKAFFGDVVSWHGLHLHPRCLKGISWSDCYHVSRQLRCDIMRRNNPRRWFPEPVNILHREVIEVRVGNEDQVSWIIDRDIPRIDIHTDAFALPKVR